LFFVPPTFPGTGATISTDFNGDGKLDLASGDGTILLGNGDGTFTVGTPFSAASAINPNLLATADFNGDGKADLIVAATGTNTFSILLGNGDGHVSGSHRYGCARAVDLSGGWRFEPGWQARCIGDD
jgi:hypothetical protein